jgi:hypothetical protein
VELDESRAAPLRPAAAGLTYHLGYSVLAAITMALLVRFAWPAHLENEEPRDEQPPRENP